MSFSVPRTFAWLAISLLLMTSGAAIAPSAIAQQEDAKTTQEETSTKQNVKSEGKEAFAAPPVTKNKRQKKAPDEKEA